MSAERSLAVGRGGPPVVHLVPEAPRVDGIVTREAVLASAQPIGDVLVSGVYFLISGEEIIYVGQSVNVYARIYQHFAAGKQFDSCAFLAVPEMALNGTEEACLKRFRPLLNRNTSGACRTRRPAPGFTSSGVPFTDDGLASLPPAKVRTDHGDPLNAKSYNSGQLMLRVSTTGRKRWRFVCYLTGQRGANGSRRRRAIQGGFFPDVSVAEARAWAQGLRDLAAGGVDPLIDDRLSPSRRSPEEER